MIANCFLDNLRFNPNFQHRTEHVSTSPKPKHGFVFRKNLYSPPMGSINRWKIPVISTIRKYQNHCLSPASAVLVSCYRLAITPTYVWCCAYLPTCHSECCLSFYLHVFMAHSLVRRLGLSGALVYCYSLVLDICTKPGLRGLDSRLCVLLMVLVMFC